MVRSWICHNSSKRAPNCGPTRQAYTNFLFSARAGYLAVAGVLTSLYPAVTVLLAAALLRERVHRGQGVGLLLCAVAVSVGYLVLVSRRTGVGVPFRLLGRLLLAFGLLCGTWYGLQYGLNKALAWWLEAGLMAVVFVVIILGTGLVRRSEIAQLMPGREN